MENLNDIKQMFLQACEISDLTERDRKSIDINELLNHYYNLDKPDRNYWISQIILYSWPVLENLYYRNNTLNLTPWECYDIFIDSIHYVLDKQIWNNKSSSLYQDKNAFMKALYVKTSSTKKNCMNGKFKQKRFANQYTISTEYIAEEYGDGFLTHTEDHPDLYRDTLEQLCKDFFEQKQYATFFIMDAILNYNVFNDDLSIDYRKVRRYLRDTRNYYCDVLAARYDIDLKKLQDVSVEYSALSLNELTSKIDNALQELRKNKFIKQILLYK